MRHCPNLRVRDFKQPDPNTGIVYANDVDGWYVIPFHGVRLTVIASDGLNWEHVSISLPNRTPTWAELDYVCRLFWRDEETVMQLHVPARDHVNAHPYCLHLWRPLDAEIPRPPAVLVGSVVERKVEA